MDYSIRTDLLKLKGAFVTNLKGQTATKRCLCIPIDDSGLFLGEKGCYLDAMAYELENPKYADTHMLKISLPKAIREAMSEEERSMLPIVGNMRPFERRTPQMPVTSTSTAEDTNDLPF